MKAAKSPTTTVDSWVGRMLFVLLAPITVPAYIIFLAAANLLGGAFYIVIEASIARIVRRPITLSRGQMFALAIPIVLLAPIATVAHLLMFAIAGIGRGMQAIGRWQTASPGPGVCFAAGLLWISVAIWTTVTCFNAAFGTSLIGRPIRGADLYAESYSRFRPLRDLPPHAQERRRQLVAELNEGHARVFPNWELLKEALEDDDCAFIRLPPEVRMKITGMPWYFIPASIAEDGLDHSELLLGPLVLVWMLLVRWPGTFVVLRRRIARQVWFLARTIGAAYAVFYLINWSPITDYFLFRFESGIPQWFYWLSPAAWIGVDFRDWVRPEWWLFNAGLWFIIGGIGTFIWWVAWWVSPMLGWPRYYVAFLASRLLQRKRIAFFSVGAVTLCVAMMIIVISVMGGFSDVIRSRAHGLLGDLVMDGGLQGFPFYQEFIDKLKNLKDARTGEPVVVQATPLVHTFGVIQFPKSKNTKSVSVWGIRLNEYVRVNEFGKDLYYQNRFGGTTLGPQQQPVYARDDRGLPVLPQEMEEHYQKYVASLSPAQQAEEQKKYHRERGDLYPGPGVFKGPASDPGYEGKKYPGLILGRSILFRRMASGEFDRHDTYPRGELCMLTILPINRGGDISPEPPPKPAFRYTDDSRTGIHEIDSVNVYADFELMQGLLSMGPEKRTEGGMTAPRCSQLLIRLAPQISGSRERTIEAKRRIMEMWNDFRADVKADMLEESMLRQVDVNTWEEMQASYISAIEKEKFLVLIMFGVISIVAVFLILCIFYMIVQEKTRDIGIIKSIGGSPAGVAAVFLAYGGAIGIVGCVLGSLLGTNFVNHINDVQDALARLNPNWRVWSPETYSFDKIPDVWKWSEVIGICILAVFASIAGATFPAIRAGKTWPMESLRYE